jgi:hypothetical protein
MQPEMKKYVVGMISSGSIQTKFPMKSVNCFERIHGGSINRYIHIDITVISKAYFFPQRRKVGKNMWEYTYI